jgi:hypothetical protein
VDNGHLQHEGRLRLSGDRDGQAAGDWRWCRVSATSAR